MDRAFQLQPMYPRQQEYEEMRQKWSHCSLSSEVAPVPFIIINAVSDDQVKKKKRLDAKLALF